MIEHIRIRPLSSSSIYIGVILSFVFLLTIPVSKAGNPAASLTQGSNGTDSLPFSPEVWINGNLSSSVAHFMEGMSVSYQTVMTNLPLNTQMSVTIGYAIMNGGKHAFDYLTQYNRLLPHTFVHHTTPEIINPLAGSGLTTAPFTTYPIPVPSSAGATAPGQPTSSFNALPASEQLMTLYNGTIDTVYYTVQGSLTASASETQLTVVFHVSASTAVLIWGGHIASRIDWGYSGSIPLSSGGINGSPFHMRIVGWSLGNLGNQDRSIAGVAVIQPPSGLPVELLSFNAEKINCNNSNSLSSLSMAHTCALLNWTTASEVNSNYFIIEKSRDNTNFENTGSVNAAGNSTSLLNYAFTDDAPYYPITYYRLKEVDYDGACQYSSVRAISIQGLFHPVTHISIYNMQGSIVRSCENTPADISLNDLPAGLYIFQFQSGGEWLTKKILIPAHYRSSMENLFIGKAQ